MTLWTELESQTNFDLIYTAKDSNGASTDVNVLICKTQCDVNFAIDRIENMKHGASLASGPTNEHYHPISNETKIFPILFAIALMISILLGVMCIARNYMKQETLRRKTLRVFTVLSFTDNARKSLVFLHPEGRQKGRF